MVAGPTAQRFVEKLEAHRSPERREEYLRHFKTGEGGYGEGDEFIGVRMGQVFALAKEFVDMQPAEIERLLDSPVHEVRAGALSHPHRLRQRRRPLGARAVTRDPGRARRRSHEGQPG